MGSSVWRCRLGVLHRIPCGVRRARLSPTLVVNVLSDGRRIRTLAGARSPAHVL